MTGRVGLNLPEERVVQWNSDGQWLDENAALGHLPSFPAARILLDAGVPAEINGVRYRYKPEPEPCLLARRWAVHFYAGGEAMWGATDKWERVPSTWVDLHFREIETLARLGKSPFVYGGREYKWGVPE